MNKSLTTIALCSILTLTACNSNNANSEKKQDSTEHDHNHDHHDGHNHDHNHDHGTQDAHNSQNSVDWIGIYQGTVPCADCPGIETTIKLYKDETYSYKAVYQDRNLTVADTGKFMWHDNGSVVHLKGKETDLKYKVGENVLMQLDAEGKQITGTLSENYNLKKAQ